MSAPVALIVGAGDYIGAAIARRFARGGFTVCLGRRNGDKLLPLVEDIQSEGGLAHGYAMDARDEDSVVDLFARVESEVGPIEVVIFNVGGNVRFPIRDTTARVFRKVWEMACFAGFLTGREAARHMAPRGRGSIFFTGASASMRGNPGFAAFAAGKAGLRALAQSMAKELGPQNIHVAHLVIDAGVDTAFVRERMQQAGRDPDTLPPDTLMSPDSVAEAYWMLHQQTRDAWSFELDLRPFGERW
ncbi:SDR family NAD(P)-dependent oxidoreductase [Ruegeria aquimaris]|uniref:SDR family NAD(P)-dependent oxidoreductase n=1 Tax=Ruegeria aquimaris TaxID=2984333 RepID=A0ABT3AMS2_9RHOB|nr:SDR family NAD(P)-dependent oxidoreductase [Ruegeria sp. XHP0148]MCV2889983.1 SDR family NAD(P)-dependent oxidoreductase [Ruegeria sp. XHP0148]